MNKLFIILVILFPLDCLAQQATKDEIMRYTLPKGTEKTDEHQLKSLSHREFNDQSVSYFHDHIYKKDGLVIYYLNWHTSPRLQKKLESTQKLMESMTAQTKNTVVDNSKIITVNNIRYSIIESHVGDSMTIQFTSDYDKNGGYINGFIEYKKPNESVATKYLQNLLENMHFKD